MPPFWKSFYFPPGEEIKVIVQFAAINHPKTISKIFLEREGGKKGIYSPDSLSGKFESQHGVRRSVGSIWRTLGDLIRADIKVRRCPFSSLRPDYI